MKTQLRIGRPDWVYKHRIRSLSLSKRKVATKIKFDSNLNAWYQQFFFGLHQNL